MATSPGGVSTGFLPGSARTAPRWTISGPCAPALTAAATASAAAVSPASSTSVAVGVVGALAREQPDGGAGLPAAAGLFDAPVLEAQAEAVAVFHEDLGEITTAAQRPLDRGLQEAGVEGCEVHQAPPVSESRTPAASVSSSMVRGSERSSVCTEPSSSAELHDGLRRAGRAPAPPDEAGDGAGSGGDEGDVARLHCASSPPANASPRQVRRSNSSRATAGRGPVTATARWPCASTAATTPSASGTTTCSRPAAPACPARLLAASQSGCDRLRGPLACGGGPGGDHSPGRVDDGDRRDVGRDVEQIADGFVELQGVLRAVRVPPYTTRLRASLTPRPARTSTAARSVRRRS